MAEEIIPKPMNAQRLRALYRIVESRELLNREKNWREVHVQIIILNRSTKPKA